MKRIVLVDPRGDVLFSGVSLAETEAAGDAARSVVANEEPCPATQRSAVFESGVYPATKAPTVRKRGSGEIDARSAEDDERAA